VIEVWILLAYNYVVWCAELFNSKDGNQRRELVSVRSVSITSRP